MPKSTIGTGLRPLGSLPGQARGRFLLAAPFLRIWAKELWYRIFAKKEENKGKENGRRVTANRRRQRQQHEGLGRDSVEGM
jgi:hypothetical protein